MSHLASKSNGAKPAKAPKPKSGKSKTASMTKAQFVGELSSKTAMSKAQINSVLGAIAELVGDEVKTGRPVAIPGLVKITTTRRAATASRPGINPFTKESIIIKAKPARTVVKVRALKALKDMV